MACSHDDEGEVAGHFPSTLERGDGLGVHLLFPVGAPQPVISEDGLIRARFYDAQGLADGLIVPAGVVENFGSYDMEDPSGRFQLEGLTGFGESLIEAALDHEQVGVPLMRERVRGV